MSLLFLKHSLCQIVAENKSKKTIRKRVQLFLIIISNQKSFVLFLPLSLNIDSSSPILTCWVFFLAHITIFSSSYFPIRISTNLIHKVMELRLWLICIVTKVIINVN